MTKTEIRRQALDLSVEERMELAAELWASIESDPRQPDLPRWQRDLLDRRITEDDADPESVTPWQEVKRQILAGLHPYAITSPHHQPSQGQSEPRTYRFGFSSGHSRTAEESGRCASV